MAARSSSGMSAGGGHGDSYGPPKASKTSKTKGKTAASLALFPIADETFQGILHKYPNAAVQLKDPAPLRKGKWSKEEEELAVTCINHFQEGLIPLSGVGDDTLRGLLSYMLHSDGMRVTKKFAGDLSIRKQQYGVLAKQARLARTTQRAMDASTRRTELAERFLASLETRGSSAKRRAPSSAAKARAVPKRKRPELAKVAKAPKPSKADSPMAVALAQSSMDAMMQSLRRAPPRSMSTEALSDLSDEYRNSIALPSLANSAAQQTGPTHSRQQPSLSSSSSSAAMAAPALAAATAAEAMGAMGDHGSVASAEPRALTAAVAELPSVSPSRPVGAGDGGSDSHQRAGAPVDRASASIVSGAAPLAGLHSGGGRGSAARLEVLDSRASPFASASSASRMSLRDSASGLMAFAGIDSDLDLSSHILPAATLSDCNTLPTAVVSMMPRHMPITAPAPVMSDGSTASRQQQQQQQQHPQAAEAQLQPPSELLAQQPMPASITGMGAEAAATSAPQG